MKIEIQHLLMGACALAAAGSEFIANYVGTGYPLPFHLAAGTALTIGACLGAVSKSILADKGAPESKIETDVLAALAASLAKPGAVASPMHLALLDAVKQNLIAPPPVTK